MASDWSLENMTEAYDDWFDTDRNRTLLAISARRLIRAVGIGGVIWGAINIAIGTVAMQVAAVNVGIVFLGLLMLGVGIQALVNPTLGVMLTATVVAGLLFAWNLAMTILNAVEVGQFNPAGLIFPVVFTVAFLNAYRKLQHVSGHIRSIDKETLKGAMATCKALAKKKLKNEPGIVQAQARRCRAQLMGEDAFFVQPGLLRAFVGSRDDIRNAVVNPKAKRLKLHFRHPLGKLVYKFDRRNSDKLKAWFSASAHDGDGKPAVGGEEAGGRPFSRGGRPSP